MIKWTKMCQKGAKEDIIIDKEVVFVFLTNALYFP